MLTVVLSSVLTLVVVRSVPGLLCEGAAAGEWDLRTGLRLVVDVEPSDASLEVRKVDFLASEDVYGVSMV